MSEKEKALVKSLTDAVNALPDNKKEYLIGFAEGVAAMMEKAALGRGGYDDVSEPTDKTA